MTYDDGRVRVLAGDCLDVLPTLPDASVDAVVTDPPYELAFMGKGWDASGVAFDPATWREVARVLKPGGHLLAFGGTRTFHRLAVAVEDAGFEIRDEVACLLWMYSTGFPKSLDVGKAIDKAAGAEREVIGEGARFGKGARGNRTRVEQGYRPGEVAPDGGVAAITAPGSPEAARWEGWGTALKPAYEPIVVARKPLAGTVAQNVLAHGTGALNIDATRVGDEGGTKGAGQGPRSDVYGDGLNGASGQPVPGLGRWPANLILTHHPECPPEGRCVPGCHVAELDAQSGVGTSTMRSPTGRDTRGIPNGNTPVTRFADTIERGHDDAGGASRFYPVFRYTAKAPGTERPRAGGVAHPTVKPVDLMRWLVRLVTPPGGLVLDPFAGSGTTGEACQAEGVRALLIEREADYLPLITQRLTKRTDPVQHLAARDDTGLGLFELLGGSE